MNKFGLFIIVTVVGVGLYQGEYNPEKIVGNIVDGTIKSVISDKTYYEKKYPELKDITYQQDYDRAMESIKQIEEQEKKEEKMKKKFSDEKTYDLWRLGKKLAEEKKIELSSDWENLTDHAREKWLNLMTSGLVTYISLEKDISTDEASEIATENYRSKVTLDDSNTVNSAINLLVDYQYIILNPKAQIDKIKENKQLKKKQTIELQKKKEALEVATLAKKKAYETLNKKMQLKIEQSKNNYFKEFLNKTFTNDNKVWVVINSGKVTMDTDSINTYYLKYVSEDPVSKLECANYLLANLPVSRTRFVFSSTKEPLTPSPINMCLKISNLTSDLHKRQNMTFDIQESLVKKAESSVYMLSNYKRYDSETFFYTKLSNKEINSFNLKLLNTAKKSLSVEEQTILDKGLLNK